MFIRFILLVLSYHRVNKVIKLNNSLYVQFIFVVLYNLAEVTAVE